MSGPHLAATGERTRRRQSGVARKDQSFLCFIHIERAGGTTLHHILRNNFPSFLTLPPSLWTNEPDATFTSEELHTFLRLLPFTRGIGGHTTRVSAGYETAASAPIAYFTYLRPPLERYVSHFRYQVARMDIPWSFEAFLAEPRFANFMTTRIAGRPDIELAKRLLRERFAFVGLTDRFDESLLLMRRALGLADFDIRYERQNAAPASGPAASGAEPLDDPAILSQVKEQNKLDLALYEFARTTLYPEYIRQYGSALSGDLERFRAENRGFRFSRRKQYVWSAYRKLVYEPLSTAVGRGHRRSRA